MRLLALDTSTELCSVALYTDGGSIDRCVEAGRGHAEQVLQLVSAVLAEAGVALAELDGIAAGIGPGAFTGVRISVAVAQGLAFGAGLPVVPVTTLEALALKAVQAGARRALACLDARMSEVYWQIFAAEPGPAPARAMLALTTPAVGPPEGVKLPGIERCAGIGRGFAAYPLLEALAGLDLAPDARLALPSAHEIAMLGALRLGQGGGLDPADLQPLYVRDNVALTEAQRRVAK
jgi:tRNA threonylcarbamoyladenosine biosynthesis protein TsaB